jgi:hypothetical protein
MAIKAGDTTFSKGNTRNNPSQCHGLSGNAELFIELYYLTKNELWLKRAYEFAVMCENYKKSIPEGDIWTADKEGYFSPDFYCGAAGTGHFFLRLASEAKILIPIS